jgi:signal transduction histidine kinase
MGLAWKLLTPTLIMKTNTTDNLTGYLEEVVSRLGSAESEERTTELVRQSAAEIRDLMNSERVEAAEKLAAWLAHKINNPLGAISGNAQLLARRLERDINDSKLLGAYLRYVEGVRTQTERCAQITGELLDFTRPRDVEFRSVDVAQAISYAVELVSYGRDMTNVTPAWESKPAACKAIADKDLLVRVLYEIILNAAQAAQENGHVIIDTGIQPESDESCERVRVSIGDTGPGISPAHLARVFDPFFSTKDKAKGLGLTTSLAIMRQLKGSIEITQTGPEGTIVSIELPARRR